MHEVCWRTYWKGWMELYPALWDTYRIGLKAALNRLSVEGGLRRDWEAACTGTTGITNLDGWARDLVATGYLDGGARTRFAEIWVLTLRLPWELGADFFLRHLLDGDPASTTLTWRWMAGRTGAAPDGIAAAKGGTFPPDAAMRAALAVSGPRPAPLPPDWTPRLPSVLLLHEDDLSPDWLLEAGLRPASTAVLTATGGRSPLLPAPAVAAWSAAAARETLVRLSGRLGDPGPQVEGAGDVAGLVDWAAASGAVQVVTAHAPVGPVADILALLEPALAARGLPLVRPLRPWDARHWPLVVHGFGRFRAGAGLGWGSARQ
ncbi:MAG TPA: FAD-binding domain-containing protein [Paracoccaceae bacterium]|nr:FAD-binding domain-containing protein [Paracoccaceae bacterium]